MLKISGLYPAKGSSDISKSRISKIASVWVPIVLWITLFYWAGGVLSRWFSPATNNVLSLSSPAPASIAGSVAQRHWFGEMVVQIDAPTSSLPNVRVVGIYAAEGNEKDNFAIVLRNGQSIPLLMGQELGNGWILSKVSATGIEVKNSDGDVQAISIASTSNDSRQSLDELNPNNNQGDNPRLPLPSPNNYPESNYPNLGNAGNPNMQEPPSYVEGNELKNSSANGGYSPPPPPNRTSYPN